MFPIVVQYNVVDVLHPIGGWEFGNAITSAECEQILSELQYNNTIECLSAASLDRFLPANSTLII